MAEASGSDNDVCDLCNDVDDAADWVKGKFNVLCAGSSVQDHHRHQHDSTVNSEDNINNMHNFPNDIDTAPNLTHIPIPIHTIHMCACSDGYTMIFAIHIISKYIL